jgi:hypothetical protein
MFRFFFLFLFCFANSQPSWLSSNPKPPVHPAVSPPAKIVYKDRIVEKIVLDTVVKVDTVVVRDTVISPPVQYKYMIRYALTSLNVDMANPEWLDYASYNEIIARDTATLKVGHEEIRTLGSVIDPHGNHIPQTQIITSGFTINVFGSRATIEYRGKSTVALFSGSFDNSGFLIANGEITETGFLASFFPLNLFFSSSKKRIIIQILREAYT